MPGLPRLLHIGAIALLLAGLAGCAQPTQSAQMTDVVEVNQLSVKAMVNREKNPRFYYAMDTVGANTPDFTQAVAEMKARNADTIGWLYVPGTDIDEVVVQNPSDGNNNYYLNVNFEGEPDRNGTFCADRRINFGNGTRSQLSRNVTIYGHSWEDDPDGILFAQLKRYQDPDFARENPYIYFSTESENMAWEVFAVYHTTVDLPYIVPDLADDRYVRMMDIVQDASIYNYDVSVSAGDKILTLSTCTFSVAGRGNLPAVNEYRFVVMARLVSPNSQIKDSAVFSVNSSPITADQTVRRYKGESQTVVQVEDTRPGNDGSFFRSRDDEDQVEADYYEKSIFNRSGD